MSDSSYWVLIIKFALDPLQSCRAAKTKKYNQQIIIYSLSPFPHPFPFPLYLLPPTTAKTSTFQTRVGHVKMVKITTHGKHSIY